MADFTDLLVMTDPAVVAVPGPDPVDLELPVILSPGHFTFRIPDDVAAYLDDVLPVVALISPPNNQPLGRLVPVVVEAGDERGLAAVFIWVQWPTGVRELAFAQGSWMPRFVGTSYTTELEPGLIYRFSVLPIGGWKQQPIVHVVPIDRGGGFR